MFQKIDLIIKILGVIIIPVVLYTISNSYNKNIKSMNDIDAFFKYSADYEKSCRAVKNYFDEVETGIVYDPVIFRDRITCLDYNVINFYYKTMMFYTLKKEGYVDVVCLLDGLYWGKKNEYIQSSGMYSFREFILKHERLSRVDKNKFIASINDIKKILQYFDDLSHLSILTTSFTLHRQGGEIENRFLKIKDNIDYLNKKVFNEKDIVLEKMKTMIDSINDI